MTIKIPRTIKRPNEKFYNRFLVKAKLKQDDYARLISYCQQHNLNISSFLKLSVSYFLQHNA